MRFGSKRKMTDRVIAFAAVFGMVFSSLNIMGLAEGKADEAKGYSKENVQLQLQDWLGDIKDYGVVADNASVTIDFESNIATNMLTTNGACMGASVDSGYVNQGCNMYIKDFEGPMKVVRRGSAEYAIYTDLTFAERNNQRIFFEEKDRNATYINIDDYPKVPIFGATNSQRNLVLDVAANLERVNKIFEAYKNTGKETEGVVKGYDSNRYVVDTTSCDEQICFVNIYLSDMTAFGDGTLNINKEENQMVVFNVNVNVTDWEGAVNIKRFYINGQSSVGADDSVTDQIIWNLAGFEGKVNIGEMAGLLVAPKANVVVTSTSNGRAICGSFSMTGGEFHFVSRFVNMEVETTTEEETTTEVETTSEVETTTETETTTEEETTTTTEAETTTEEETTTTTEAETTTEEETTTVPEYVDEETTESTTENTTTESETTTVPEEEITTSIPYAGVEEPTPENPTTTVEPETPEEEPVDFVVPLAGPQTGDSSNLAFYLVMLIGSASVLVARRIGVFKKSEE